MWLTDLALGGVVIKVNPLWSNMLPQLLNVLIITHLSIEDYKT